MQIGFWNHDGQTACIEWRQQAETAVSLGTSGTSTE